MDFGNSEEFKMRHEMVVLALTAAVISASLGLAAVFMLDSFLLGFIWLSSTAIWSLAVYFYLTHPFVRISDDLVEMSPVIPVFAKYIPQEDLREVELVEKNKLVLRLREGERVGIPLIFLLPKRREALISRLSQMIPRVENLPAFVCPGCSVPNDAHAIFCEKCGFNIIKHKLELAEKDHPHIEYAGFAARLSSFAIDCLICLVPIAYLFSASSVSKQLALGLAPPLVFALPMYRILCHGTWGATIGKVVMRIRLVSPAGKPVNWKSVFQRHIAELIYAVMTLAAVALAITYPGPLESQALETYDGLENQPNLMLPAVFLTGAVMFAWALLESIVMILSEKRRALSDHIGRSVVVDVGTPWK